MPRQTPITKENENDSVLITLRVIRRERERYQKIAKSHESLSHLIIALLKAYEKQPEILNVDFSLPDKSVLSTENILKVINAKLDSLSYTSRTDQVKVEEISDELKTIFRLDDEITEHEEEDV